MCRAKSDSSSPIFTPPVFASFPAAKGRTRKFRHPKYAGAVILSGADGDDAHYYQEKQVRNATREVTK